MATEELNMKGEYHVCLYDPEEPVGLLLDAHKKPTFSLFN